MRRRVFSTLVILSFALLTGAVVPPALGQAPAYEVWVLDQSDAALGGNKLYIYQSASFQGATLSGAPEVVDLQAAAAGVGHGPGVRPHMMLFNPSQTHGIIAHVASGHVHFVRAADRRVTGSIDVGEQAHAAIPSGDESIVIVANQNGKKLARITTDYASDRYGYNPADDLDLKALESNDLPDNAPICPVLVRNSKKAYITLRGGGLLVVDTGSTPMRVLKTYGRNQIFGNGCGGIQVGDKMYINSGTATASHLYMFDVRTDDLIAKVGLPPAGSDGHGMLATRDGRYVWMANRGQGDNVVVIETATDLAVNIISNVGDAPDLMELSPGGDLAFVSLRGPKALTGGPSAIGSTPGLSVLRLSEGGLFATRQMFVPIGDQSPTSDVDPHGIGVRVRTDVPAAPAAISPPSTGSGGLAGRDPVAGLIGVAVLLVVAASFWTCRVRVR